MNYFVLIILIYHFVLRYCTNELFCSSNTNLSFCSNSTNELFRTNNTNLPFCSNSTINQLVCTFNTN